MNTDKKMNKNKSKSKTKNENKNKSEEEGTKTKMEIKIKMNRISLGEASYILKVLRPQNCNIQNRQTMARAYVLSKGLHACAVWPTLKTNEQQIVDNKVYKVCRSITQYLAKETGNSNETPFIACPQPYDPD